MAASEPQGGASASSGLEGPLLVLTAVELEVLEVAHLRGLADHVPADPASDGQPGPATRGAPGPLPGEAAGPWSDEASHVGSGEVTHPTSEETDAAWEQAIRSLTARGLVDARGRLSEVTASGVLAQTILDVRLGASAVLVVERLLGDPQESPTGPPAGEERGQDSAPAPHPPPGAGRRDLRILHLVELGGVVEDVHPDGAHGLDLVLDPAHLVDAVTQMLLPPDAAPGAGPTVLGARPEEFGERLGHPTVLAELTLVGPDPQAPAEGVLLALGPGGCFQAPRPAPAGQVAAPPLDFAPVDPSWVGAVVGGWVEAVVARAQ